jgi:peroxiredoxin family protein
MVSSASYERVLLAARLALSLQAQGKQVYLFFSYGAVSRLRKGMLDAVSEETEEWLREVIREGLKKGSVHKISEVLREFKLLGGKIYACSSALIMHGLELKDLEEIVDAVKPLPAFLRDEAYGAQIIGF